MAQRQVVVVTGAHGFIGSALCAALVARGCDVRALVRALPAHPRPDRRSIALGNLETCAEEALDGAVRGAFAVVHLAGRAHVLREDARDAEAAYMAANATATARLAAAAARAGVARFILASSVKVNGESTAPGRPFRPEDPPRPEDAYARSKWRAEEAVAGACAGTATVPLVLRLPLVYGPRVRGNFAALFDAVAARRVLPVGGIDNRRSLAFVGNVTDAVAAALALERPPGGVHFVADGAPVSTPGLVRAMGEALDTPARMLSVPVALLRLAGAVSGRRAAVERLVGSLEVDASSLTAATGWRPAFGLAEGLAATAAWWRARHAI